MSLWTPEKITTALWLDAADSSTLFDATTGGSLVASDGAIARWEDKSGNGRHMTQGTLGARPIRKTSIQNGKDVARGDGARRMSIPSSTAMFNEFHTSQAWSLVVAKAGVSDNPNAIYGFVGNAPVVGLTRSGFAMLFDDRASLPINNRAGSGIWRNNTEVVARSADNFTPNVFGILDGAYDVTNATLANKITLEINGGSIVNTAVGTYSATTQQNASGDLFVFDYGASNFLVGDIGEVILFNSLPIRADRDKVVGYAAWKWGLQGNLPANHPYKNAAPQIGGGGRLINGGLISQSLVNRSLIR